MHNVNPVFEKVITYPPYSKDCSKCNLHHCTLPEEKTLNWQWCSPSESSVSTAFCLRTSLHGLQYVGEKRRHIFERVFWAIAFLASVITAGILISNIWNQYKTMPIITVFNPTEMSLDEIPFPAVTICNVNGLQKSALKAEIRKIKAIVEENTTAKDNDTLLRSLAMIVDMNYICDTSSTYVDRFVGNTSILEWFPEVKELVLQNREAIRKFRDPLATLRSVSQPCETMILNCIWLDTVRNCSELFNPIETDYGYCCTFNSVPVSLLLKDTVDDRYDPKVVEAWNATNLKYENLIFTDATDSRRLPYRQRYPGRFAGLSFLLNPELDDYFCANSDSKGFMMGLNVPLDFPRMSDDGLAIRTNSELFIGVRPDITLSEDTLASFTVDKRQCYYENEHPLLHYNVYTVSNCMDECIARETLKRCKCLRFYMPRFKSNAICGPMEYNCTQEVQTAIVYYGLGKVCKECLPTCTEINYRKEITLLKVEEEKIDSLVSVLHEKFNPRHVSLVHVYLDVDSVYPKLRKQLTSMSQLLSNAGGLLGLCMGFSVLSFLEIFYFGTIRFCCNLYRDRIAKSRDKEGNANLVHNDMFKGNNVEYLSPTNAFMDKVETFGGKTNKTFWLWSGITEFYKTNIQHHQSAQ